MERLLQSLKAGDLGHGQKRDDGTMQAPGEMSLFPWTGQLLMPTARPRDGGGCRGAAKEALSDEIEIELQYVTVIDH